MRKFYIITHNPNTVSEAINALQNKANAIEPDITWYNNDFYVFDSDQTTPSNPLTLAQYCRDLATQLLLPQNSNINLALIAWDMKSSGDSHFDFWKIRDIIVSNFVDVLNEAK